MRLAAIAILCSCGGIGAQTYQFSLMSKGADFPDVGSVQGRVAADFDKDGDIDIVVLCTTFPQCNQLLENRGAGLFVARSLGNPPEGYTCVAAGDVNGDGNLDLFLGSATPSQIATGRSRLLLGAGNGTFSDVTTTHLPSHTEFTTDVAFGDVDRDGDLDVVLAQQPSQPYTGQTRLYLNDGTGRFSDATSWLPSDNDRTQAVALGDVDKDGDLDVILGNMRAVTPKIGNRLYLNNGRGVFTDGTAGRLTTNTAWTFDVALADLDRDGDLDLVEAQYQYRNVVHVNDGKGVFRIDTSRMPQERLSTMSIVVSDMDRDGDPDLLLGNRAPDQDVIYVNDGKGTFTNRRAQIPSEITSGSANIVADFDGDGDVDLFLAGTRYPPGAELFWNTGNLRFVGTQDTLGPPFDASTRNPIATADFDSDGNLDVVTTRGPYGARLYFGTGGGRFRDVTATHAPVLTGNFSAIAAVDVDGDKDLDVVFVSYGSQALWLNNSAGRFSDASGRLPTATAARAIAAGDVNRDGRPDLVIANDAAQNQLWLNTGARFVDLSVRLPVDRRHSRDVALVDVDGDGDLDVTFANGRPGGPVPLPEPNALYINDGRGVFASRTLSTVSEVSVGVAAGDIDRDGDNDLVFGNNRGTFWPALNELYVNDGKGSFTISRALPPAQSTTDVALVDVDADGTIDLVQSGLPAGRIALGDGRGRFSVPRTARIGPLIAQSVHVADADGDGDADLFLDGGLWVNRHRQTFASSLARIGGRWTIQVFAEPGYAPTTIPALPILGLAPLDPGVVTPFGILRLDPRLIVLLDAVGVDRVRDVNVSIPNVPALAGLRLYAQSIVFHGGGLAGARLANRFSDPMIR